MQNIITQKELPAHLPCVRATSSTASRRRQRLFAGWGRVTHLAAVTRAGDVGEVGRQRAVVGRARRRVVLVGIGEVVGEAARPQEHVAVVVRSILHLRRRDRVSAGAGQTLPATQIHGSVGRQRASEVAAGGDSRQGV